MVNLTIRLGKAGASPGEKQQEQGGGTIPFTTKAPSIPPHLADTDLPLVRGVGTVFSEACAANFVGVKARRRPGDKVHICVRCNFPIAVYGRLIPCEHVFCLTCAKVDSTCFLCEERVTRIQKMDVLEGIFICGAPGCLRSFLARPDFDLHMSDSHHQLFQLDQGQLSPERNVSAGNPVAEAQVQSHEGGQQHADFAPPVRQPSGTLQVILPKKEPQRKPLKGVRQNSQGLLARPVPELRLPDQFPHHRGGEQQTNQSNHDNRRTGEQKLRRPVDWDLQAPQVQIENEREPGHEEEATQRERRADSAGRRKERDGEKELRSPHPPSFLPPKNYVQKQKEHQSSQQPAPNLPPPPYPPPSFSPAYLPQQDGNGFPARFEAPRGFHPRPRHPNQNSSQNGFNPNGPPRPPLDGYGQTGPPRPLNGNSQDSFGQFRPHFHSEYGPPMGMGAPRYHEGPLPPPPPGPLPKRPKFNGPQGSGEPMMDYGWGPGNPGNFGGPPGGHVYSNWMPPANS